MNKDKYIKITKNVIMFFMYFLWQIVPILFLEVMGLDSSKFNLFQKNLYLILSNLSYLIIVVLVYYKELKLDFKKYKKNFRFGLRLSYFFITFKSSLITISVEHLNI